MAGPGVCEVDRHKPRDKSSDPIIGLDFDKIFNPYAIIHILETLALHRAVVVDKIL